jgi:hypothetical protein
MRYKLVPTPKDTGAPNSSSAKSCYLCYFFIHEKDNCDREKRNSTESLINMCCTPSSGKMYHFIINELSKNIRVL